MHDLCVKQDVIASEGARILGVPKEVFLAWRNKFRFGPLQLRADMAERWEKDQLDQYKNELQSIDLNRKFIYDDVQSLDGFKEMMERLLEVKKVLKINNDPQGFSNMSLDMDIMFIEQVIHYIDLYSSGELRKQIEIED